MQINKLGSLVSTLSKKTGEAILNKRPCSEKLSQNLKRINNFTQGVSYNPGRAAYYTIMGLVILPRLLEAREPDEFREILTRDVVSVFTILFAMKALKTGMSLNAQKKSGIVLVKNKISDDASKFKKVVDCINPVGTTPLSSREILSRYSRFDDKECLVKALKTLDAEGGNIAKALSIEEQGGIFAKIKKYIPVPEKEKSTPLLDAAKKVFGDDFASKNNQELINALENIAPDNKKALEGLEDLIGSKAAGITRQDNAKKGILNYSENPITVYARKLSSRLDNISLGVTVGFLGFGLPKINEKLTIKKHSNEPLKNSYWNNEETREETPPKQIYNYIKSEKPNSPFNKIV